MTEQQFTVLADIFNLSEVNRHVAHAVIFGNAHASAIAAETVEKLKQADATIRGVYVIHGPMEFRITVGHRDTHRAPGLISLKVGDMVRLVAQSTERYIPVQVTALPDSPAGYYSGVITRKLVKNSRYQVGNGVRFSEDQVMVKHRTHN